MPRAGTWIEMPDALEWHWRELVVPRAGTWIEMVYRCKTAHTAAESCPVRARGLKYFECADNHAVRQVVPRAGTWIEILTARCRVPTGARRAPCGHVD